MFCRATTPVILLVLLCCGPTATAFTMEAESGTCSGDPAAVDSPCCAPGLAPEPRTSLYNAPPRPCSGRGACIVNATSGNASCKCQKGNHWASGTGAEWQVAPENIKSKGRDCSSMRAKAPSLVGHYILLFLTFIVIIFGCWWLFGPPLPAVVASSVPPPPQVWRFTAQPWLLPKATAICAFCTIVATVTGALFAGSECDCFWIGNSAKYGTISGLAEHPPMTVITPLGCLTSSIFLTATIFAFLKRALSLPYYNDWDTDMTDSFGKGWNGHHTNPGGLRGGRAGLWLWAFTALNSALWGIGVNVFFNGMQASSPYSFPRPRPALSAFNRISIYSLPGLNNPPPLPPLCRPCTIMLMQSLGITTHISSCLTITSHRRASTWSSSISHSSPRYTLTTHTPSGSSLFLAAI